VPEVMLEALRLVALEALTLVRPAPLPPKLPAKVPAKMFAALVTELAPLKTFVPLKVWLRLSNGTLAESRASARVPEVMLVALMLVALPPLRLVKPAPLPLKLPQKGSQGGQGVGTNERLVAVQQRTLGVSRASARVPEVMVEAFRFVRPAPLTLVKPAPFPLKLPTNLFAALVRELTPLNVFEPAKVWLAVSRGTLFESRASARVPDVMLEALRFVRVAPLMSVKPARCR